MKLLNRLFKRPETKTVVVNNQSDAEYIQRLQAALVDKRKKLAALGEGAAGDSAALTIDCLKSSLESADNTLRGAIHDARDNLRLYQDEKVKVRDLKAKVKKLTKETALSAFWFDSLKQHFNIPQDADQAHTTKTVIREYVSQVDRMSGAKASLKDLRQIVGVPGTLSELDSLQAIKAIFEDTKAELEARIISYNTVIGQRDDARSSLDKCRNDRANWQAIIQCIRLAIGAHESMNDAAVVEMVKENFETIETLTETNQRLVGRVDTLQAALHHAQAHMSKVWAHKEKGGRYRNIGDAIQAGVFADRDDQDYQAYQCIETGNVYIRLADDFMDKMHIIEDLSND